MRTYSTDEQQRKETSHLEGASPSFMLCFSENELETSWGPVEKGTSKPAEALEPTGSASPDMALTWLLFVRT